MQRRLFGRQGREKINALEAAGYIGILAYYGIVVFTSSQAAQMLSILFVMIGFMFVYVFTFPQYEASQVMAAFSALPMRQ